MRIVALAVLVLLLCATVYGQQVPESKRQQGETYRYYWNVLNADTDTAITIRFPRKSSGSNAQPTPGDFSNLNTTALGPHTVWHVEVQQVTISRPINWIIYSSAFPAGVDTVWTNSRVPTFTISGVPIDSVVADTGFGGTSNPNLQLLASD